MLSESPEISFFSEDVPFEFTHETLVSDWIQNVANNHNATVGELSFIFCSDEYLHKINVEYLDHDTYTDIITFDNAEEEGLVEGDIFISVDRIEENASQFETSFDNELFRVIIHGVLHLLGFKDKTAEESDKMRKNEDACLSLLRL